jgi:hypothetical protein
MKVGIDRVDAERKRVDFGLVKKRKCGDSVIRRWKEKRLHIQREYLMSTERRHNK